MPSREFIESREEMERILSEETVGYLGLSMNGKPYVVPLNYGYVGGKISFHCVQQAVVQTLKVQIWFDLQKL